MADFFAFFTNLGQGVDADLKMNLRPIAGDLGVAFGRFDSLGSERLVGDQQQSATGNLVFMPDHKDGGGLHVDGNGGVFFELVSESCIVFPDSTIGGVNDSRPVFEALVD